MNRRTFLKTTAALVSAPAFASAASPFSWDRVPMYGHLGKSPGDFTEPELDFMARHFSLITIEKGQAVGTRKYTEDGIFEAARQLKKLNPQARVLFYWNAFLDYPLYRNSLAEVKSAAARASWLLKNARGEPFLKDGRIGRYDLSIPEVREWWSGVAAGAMRAAPLDGVFVDALPQALSPALPRPLGEEKARAIAAGLRVMLDLTRRKIGPDKIILANGLRGPERAILGWDSIDGYMIEHFGAFSSTSPADMRADIESLALARAAGKFVVLKGWPGFDWRDAAMMARPHAELLKLARERLTFPLACFLVGAREQSRFCYSWGYRESHGMLDEYPEFSRPLGAPRGDAAWTGDKATRQFEHAAVEIDLEKRHARIVWS